MKLHGMLPVPEDRRQAFSPTQTRLVIGKGKAARTRLAITEVTEEEGGRKGMGTKEEVGTVPWKNLANKESTFQKLKISSMLEEEVEDLTRIATHSLQQAEGEAGVSIEGHSCLSHGKQR